MEKVRVHSRKYCNISPFETTNFVKNSQRKKIALLQNNNDLIYKCVR